LNKQLFHENDYGTRITCHHPAQGVTITMQQGHQLMHDAAVMLLWWLQ